MNELYQLNEDYYYVYEHWLDERVIYVGKGKKDRALSLKRNEFWKDAIKDDFFNIDITIKAYFDNEKDAFDYEKKLIRRHLRDGQPLANVEHGNIDFSSKDTKEVEIEEISIEIMNEVVFYSDIELVKIVKKEIKNNKKIIIFSRGANTSTINNLSKIENIKMLEMYTRTKERKIFKNKDLKKGLIPEEYNVIFFPIEILSLSKIKIIDECVNSVVINDKFINKNIALNKIDKNLEYLYVKKDKKETFSTEINHNIVKQYLNKNLKTSEKRILCKKLNISNKRNGHRKWPTTKKLLKNSGYEIIDKVIIMDNKQQRVSFIKKI